MVFISDLVIRMVSFLGLIRMGTTRRASVITLSKRRSYHSGLTSITIYCNKLQDSPNPNPLQISVYYSGKLKSTNKVFDEVTSGPGLSFRLGRGDVIDGWDIGVIGMRVGGKRIISCPPAMAYGVKGYPPVIPPNSTLIFEVELKDVK